VNDQRLSKISEKKLFCFALILLSALVIGIYGQVSHFEFINLDDGPYIQGNPHIQKGFTPEAVKWAFTAGLFFESSHIDYWQPVTVFSRILDIKLFGLNPAGHHLMNVYFHLLNTFLIFYLFYVITGAFWKSLLLATFFAVHPLQVEPVCWVTARKDLLSAFFGFLTFIAYVEHIRKPSTRTWIPVYIFFILGLMSKPVLAVLPLILIVIDWWILKRRNITEKIPLFFLGFLVALTPVLGPIKAVSYAPPLQVLYTSIINYPWYLEKFLWPARLGILSPDYNIVIVMQKAVSSLAIIFAFGFMAFRARNRFSYIAAGLLWFVIFLFPSSFISTISSRFMYLPLAGLGIVLAWSAGSLIGRFPKIKIPAVFLICGLVMGWAALAFQFAGRWQNNRAILTESLQISDKNFVAANNFGNILFREGKVNEAILQYQDAIKINPRSPKPYFNLANIEYQQGKTNDAIRHYLQAIQLDPDYEQAHYNLANVLSENGRREPAIFHFKEAIRSNPEFAAAYQNLAADLLDEGNVAEAEKYLKRWAECRPK